MTSLISQQSDGVARFDVDNDGYLEATEWVGPNELLLAIDRNANGSIDSASELFNGLTTMVSARGMTSLGYYDANGDGVLNSLDPAFKMLRLWMDMNSDGASGSLELFDMEGKFAGTQIQALNAGITEINLNTHELKFSDNTTASMAELKLQAERGGIQVAVDEYTKAMFVEYEDIDPNDGTPGKREAYVTLNDDMSQLQRWADPTLTEAQRGELRNIAYRYGLDVESEEFFFVVESLKKGAEGMAGGSGALYISSGAINGNTALAAKLEAMKFTLHSVTDAADGDVLSLLAGTASLRSPQYASEFIDLGLAEKGQIWRETLVAGSAASDPLNPDGIRPIPPDTFVIKLVHAGLDWNFKQSNVLLGKKYCAGSFIE
ncbi:MAG: hypothetical protein C4K60_04015 [Ideonella sp. MAG2]|nr:MAG: hypothetical protein C4K60_04015 [Ideonella sp. MAG2]